MKGIKRTMKGAKDHQNHTFVNKYVHESSTRSLPIYLLAN